MFAYSKQFVFKLFKVLSSPAIIAAASMFLALVAGYLMTRHGVALHTSSRTGIPMRPDLQSFSEYSIIDRCQDCAFLNQIRFSIQISI